MNDLFASFGLLDWKPLVATLLLPPVPLLAMLLLGWWWQRRRPALATLLTLLAIVGLWFSHCQITGELLERQLMVAPSLSTQRLAELRRSAADNRTAIVVLGGGVRPLASEYGESHLGIVSMERLHYGLWLARQVPAPILVSGGAGWSQMDAPSEATVAGRVAGRDYGRPIRWLETESRDTRGNARNTLQLLHKDNIGQVLLVTHAWHMRRAVRAFTEEAAHAGLQIRVVPAPMGMVADRQLPARWRWMPSTDGNTRVHQALREWIGLASGA